MKLRKTKKLLQSNEVQIEKPLKGFSSLLSDSGLSKLQQSELKDIRNKKNFEIEFNNLYIPKAFYST